MNNKSNKLYHIYDSAIIGTTSTNRTVYSVKRIKEIILADYYKLYNDSEKAEYISFQITDLLINNFYKSSKKDTSPVFLNDLPYNSKLNLF